MLSNNKIKNKKRKTPVFSRLGLELIGAIVLAFIVSFAVMLMLMSIEYKVVSTFFSDPRFISQKTGEQVQRLQNYIDKKNISSDNIELIDEYSRKSRNLIVILYDEEGVFYDSTKTNNEDNKEKKIPPKKVFDDIETFSLKFSDRTVNADVLYLVNYYFHFVFFNCSFGISVFVFLLIFLFVVKKRTDYINLAYDEIKILKGGNLEYPMTIKGRDELTDLVRNIDEMRIAILERQDREIKLQESSHNLVRAMSHDLRTPLTVLIGLLDIIESKKYKDSSQLDSYIEKSREKAYQIKEMSDKLFEYFLAYNADETQLQFEVYDVSVLDEMLQDWIFSIGERGFLTNYGFDCQSCDVRLDIKLFRRVLDNIFSNIIKYADKEFSVEIKTYINDNNVIIDFSNRVIKTPNKVESSNIGLDVCGRIVSCHKGVFTYSLEDDSYQCSISIPLIRKSV